VSRSGSFDPGSSGGSRRRVAVLVFNGFTNDSRVLNTAQSLVDAGDDVTVLGVQVGDLPPSSVAGNDVSVVRLPFDPVYHRLWQHRAEFLRPWRHPREIGASLGHRLRRAGPLGKVGTAAAAVLLGVPWLVVSSAYIGVARVAWTVRRALGQRPRGHRGAWLEERYKHLLYLAPHAVRVVTWSREVWRAFSSGLLEPAHVWHANDLETLPVALALRRRHGGRVVYDSHEVWMDMPGPSRMGRARRWMLARAEAWMARSADARVTINDALADVLERRWSSERPVVIRSLPRRWSPPEAFESPLRAALVARGIPADRRVVLYHGNLEAGRGIAHLVAATERVDEIALAFLGGGSLTTMLDETAARPAFAGRLAVLPPVPPEDVIAWVAGTDISACLIEPTTLSLRLSSPNKLYQAIAAGVLVLGSDMGPIHDDVQRYGVGVTCDPADPVAIAAALRSLLAFPPERIAELRSNARRAHLKELNWEREAARLLAIYEDLAPRTMRGAVPAAEH
jgi:glycogen(starch) synthase